MAFWNRKSHAQGTTHSADDTLDRLTSIAKQLEAGAQDYNGRVVDLKNAVAEARKKFGDEAQGSHS